MLEGWRFFVPPTGVLPRKVGGQSAASRWFYSVFCDATAAACRLHQALVLHTGQLWYRLLGVQSSAPRQGRPRYKST